MLDFEVLLAPERVLAVRSLRALVLYAYVRPPQWTARTT